MQFKLTLANFQIETWKFVVGFSSLNLISEILFVEGAIHTSFLPCKEVF